MGYWKSKVLPKIKKYLEKPGSKKAAAEACKSFDGSKEEINKEFEEKKTDIQPRVIEIYEASSTEVKTVVKERKETDIKKNSAAVHKFLEELVKIEFPGSKQVCEASSKFGPALVPGPVFFVFEKVSTFIVTEEGTEKEVREKGVVEEEEKGSIEEVIELKSETIVEEEKASTAEPSTEPVKVEEEPAKP